MFENLVVLELANVLAGPATGMFFAELGARVIKVENPHSGGDVTRLWKLPTEDNQTGISAYFSAVNWGKESIGLDLKSPEGLEVTYQLAQKADLVISSFLPGSDKKLKLDAASLMRVNPALICAEINGYGDNDNRPAYDAIIQAEAGFTYMNGIDKEHIHKMPVALMDLLAAHQLKEAILLAYIKKLQTGKGSRVTISLIEAAISSLANQATNWLVGKHLPRPSGSEHPNIVPYGTIFQTLDQKGIILAVGTDMQFQQLCDVLKLSIPDHFRKNTDRVANRDEVNTILAEKISVWARDILLDNLRRALVPAGALNNMEEVLTGKYAENLILTGGRFNGLTTFSGRSDFHLPPIQLREPPSLGQHSDKILSWAGYAAEEITILRKKNIIL